MMASVLLSRIIGLLREIVIAQVGGANAAVDAYNVAFNLPDILNHVIGSGFLSVTFIPIFSGYLARENEAEGWRVFSIILCAFGTVLALLIALAWSFAHVLVPLSAPGLTDPAQIASAVRMTRIMLPAQLFFFAGGLLMAVQFAKEQFKLPALAPLIYNIGIISGGLLLSRWLGMEGFAWGATCGALLGSFLVQYFGAKRVGLRLNWILDWRNPDLKKYVALTLPLMLGLTMIFSNELLTRFFGSYLPEGGIASLNYALRVMFILVAFFGQSASAASFPFLARLVAESKMAEMNKLLNDTLRRYIALVIPFSVLLFLVRHEAIHILFQRGRFDALATARTAEVLGFFLIGAFAVAGQTVVVRGFYAAQNTLFPTIVSTLSVAASLPLYWLGVREWGSTGLALAISIASILQVTLLYALWNRRSKNVGSRAVYAFFVKIIALSVSLGFGLHWFKSYALGGFNVATFSGCVLICLVLAVAFGGLFVAAAYVFRVREIVDTIAKVQRRLIGRNAPRH
ncbi:murein biosynthesis integral membrane protein MurJ [candidate division KSB1 bacterium]|nr:murein biosynthesis integral membrane protein MurJ [candidate division KSB1 bacterium]